MNYSQLSLSSEFTVFTRLVKHHNWSPNESPNSNQMNTIDAQKIQPAVEMINISNQILSFKSVIIDR